MRPRFLFIGNGPSYNRGCEAILLATASMLRTSFPECSITESPRTNGKPVDRKEYERLKIAYRPKPRKNSPAHFLWQIRKRVLKHQYFFERYVNQSDIVLSLGGDNYTLDYGDPNYYFNLNNFVLSNGKPLIIWGASVGPFSENHELATKVAEKFASVTAVCARESITVEYLKSIGLKNNIHPVTDPAFLLPLCTPELDQHENAILARKHIGLNLSPLLARYQNYSRPWPEFAAHLVQDILESVDYPIALIPHVLVPGNDDHAFMNDVLNRLESFRDRLVLIRPIHSARQLKWIMSQMKIFIGARTHATISALSSCIPTISISYSTKSRGINKDIFGSEEWVISCKEHDLCSLPRKTAELIAASDSVSQFLKKTIGNYSEKAREGITCIKKILADTGSARPA